MKKKVEINDIEKETVLGEEELKHVKGGLLPAIQDNIITSKIQKVRISEDQISYKI